MKRLRDAIASACGWCSTIAIAVGCSGAQQGYYSSCDEPAGVVLGCEQPPPIEDFTAWDACDKLVRCGIVLAQEEDDNDDNTPTEFEDCVAEVEAAQDAQGDTLLACIAESSCPDLAATDPATTMDEDPNPANDDIEGVIGYCGRLDPNGN